MSSAVRSNNRSQRSRPRSFALHSDSPGVQPSRNPQNRSGSQKTGGGVLPSPNPVVRRLPFTQPMPSWLRMLLRTQRLSVIVAFVLVAATLLIYSSTMYTQQLWSKEYRKLEQLKRQERQMLTSGELLKAQIASEAERPGSGLVSRTVTGIISLRPASLRQVPMPNSVQPKVTSAESAPRTPLGY